jgi:hypothetical protein
MTNYEYELIDLIRNNDDPEQALVTAIDIICQYLKLHGSSQEQPVAGLQESA